MNTRIKQLTANITSGAIMGALTCGTTIFIVSAEWICTQVADYAHSVMDTSPYSLRGYSANISLHLNLSDHARELFNTLPKLDIISENIKTLSEIKAIWPGILRGIEIMNTPNQIQINSGYDNLLRTIREVIIPKLQITERCTRYLSPVINVPNAIMLGAIGGAIFGVTIAILNLARASSASKPDVHVQQKDKFTKPTAGIQAVSMFEKSGQHHQSQRYQEHAPTLK